ncbi:MAG: GAF domain-containing protein, partial [Anaerolineaceae bacterium]|nr:GAF domain-containing protein [Anaerolineaceae bacterium]
MSLFGECQQVFRERVVFLREALSSIDVSEDYYLKGEGYSGYLIKERKALFFTDTSTDSLAEELLADSEHKASLLSFMGVPMVLGKKLIGTLEIGSLRKDVYRKNALTLLELMSGQVALALNSIKLEKEEQRHEKELSALERLTRDFSSLGETRNIFNRFVQIISPLIPVDVLGFLIYDESKQILEGKGPFKGLPPQFVDLYKTSVSPGSPAEKILLQHEILSTMNAADSSDWATLGLAHLAQAASLHESILAPLMSGGRMHGFLQASNHVGGGTAFSDEEIRLITLAATQAAPIIENINLLQTTSRKNTQAEILRRITSIASSDANQIDILKLCLRELLLLMRCDVALLFLFDRTLDALTLHPSSIIDGKNYLHVEDQSISMGGIPKPLSVTGSQNALISGNASDDDNLMSDYKHSLSEWGVESVLMAPLIFRNEGIGEVWLGSRSKEYFNQDDLHFLSTSAIILADIVEIDRLLGQTDENLRRRAKYLTSLQRISLELSSSLDIRHLLKLIYDEAIRATGADSGTILVFDYNQPVTNFNTINSFVGDSRFEPFSPLELAVLENEKLLNLNDVHRDDLWIPNEAVEAILLVPICFQTRKVGIILLYSKQKDQFDETSVEAARTLAAQAAIVLGNAQQYDVEIQRGEQLKSRLDTMEKLFQVSQSLQANRPLKENLEKIAEGIRDLTQFDAVMFSIYDPVTTNLHKETGVGIPPEVWEEIKDLTQSWLEIKELFKPEYRINRLYYIPGDSQEEIPQDYHLKLLAQAGDENDLDAWSVGDGLFAPLYNAYGTPLGLVNLDNPRNGRKPDRVTIEALELFAMQASLMIEGHRYIHALATNFSELQSRHSQMQLSARNFRTRIPMLLRKDLGQMLTIQQLERQINRIGSGPEIIDAISRQPDIPSLLRVLAHEMLAHFDMQLAMVAAKKLSGLSMFEVVGTIPQRHNPEIFLGQRNPLSQVLQDGRIILVHEIESDPDWANNALLDACGARSFICLPLNVDEEQSFAILLSGQRHKMPFGIEDIQFFTQLASQVSINLQNLQLLNNTRVRLREVGMLLDFSRKLGGVDPNEIVNVLLESAMQVTPASDSGWVGIWEAGVGQLLPVAASGYSDPDSLLDISIQFDSTLSEADEANLLLPLQVLRSGESMRVDEVQFARDYILPSDDLMRYRQATKGRLPVSSLLAPLRRGRHVLGVLVLDNFSTPAVFTNQDDALAVLLAEQTALALENAQLFIEAEQRSNQLFALNRVSSIITSNLSSTELKGLLLDQIGEILPYETATLWFRKGEQVYLAAASGFPDNESRVDLSVAIEDSLLFQDMVRTGEPIFIGDVRKDARFPAILEPDYLSWLGLPLFTKSELIGVIALEKREIGFYTSELIQAG